MTWRMATALLLAAVPTTATAQIINREAARYDRTRADCEYRQQQRVRRAYDARCVAAATVARDSCLAAADRRYQSVLRRLLRPRY